MNPKYVIIYMLFGVSFFFGKWAYAENPTFAVDEGTYVNHIDRFYGESHSDLSFFVLGDSFELVRRYRSDIGWEFEAFFARLTFVLGRNDASIVDEILRDGDRFVLNTDRWVLENYEITFANGGYRFLDNTTQRWEQYDIEGYMTAFGIGALTQAEISYDGSRRVNQVSRPDNTIIATIDYNTQGLVTRAENHGGGVVEYVFNGSQLETFTDMRGNTTQYTYDSSGRISRKNFVSGLVREIRYNSSSGDVQSITNATGWGYTYEFSYDDEFQQFYSKESYSQGKIIERVFDSTRRLVQVKVNRKIVLTYDYLDNDNIVIATDALGNVTEEFTQADRTTKTLILPDGSQRIRVNELQEPDANLLKVRETDGRGYTTRYRYNNLEQLIETVQAEGTDAERTMRYTYDTNGNRKTMTMVGDAQTQEATTTYDYDDYNRLTLITYPEGNTRGYAYDTFNRRISDIDGNGDTTTFDYNEATGDLLRTITPLGFDRVFQYDNLGRNSVYINGLGHATLTINHFLDRTEYINAEGGKYIFRYNQAGLIADSEDPTGIQTTYTYDECGRSISETDGNGNVQEMVYHEDAFSYASIDLESGGYDLIEKVVYPTFEERIEYDSMLRIAQQTVAYDGLEATNRALSFDEESNLTAMADARNNIEQFAYDPFGEITERATTVGGQSKSVRYVFNDRGQTLEVQTENNKTYRYEYDLNDNVVKKVMPDGSEYIYTYDGNDNTETILSPNGRYEVIEYDINQRPIRRLFYDQQGDASPAITYSYTFNDADQLTGVADGVIIQAYTYDRNGRVIAQSLDYGNGITLSHTFSYYANGQLETFTGPDAITYTYRYDAAGFLASIASAEMGTVGFDAYKWKKPQLVNYPGGIQRRMDYNGLLEITGVEMVDSSSNVLFDEAYERNLQNQVTRITTPQGTIDYTYDEEIQLTSATSTISGVPTEAFSYDLNENRLSDSNVSNYTYNALNNMVTRDSVPLTYDANGNLTSETRKGAFFEYRYNAANQLAQVYKDMALLATYQYSPDNRRIAKTVNGVTTYYHYSQQGLIAEADSSGAITRSYVYEVDDYPSAQGNALAARPFLQREGSEVYFFVLDHNFRPRMLVHRAGAIGWQAQTAAYGESFINGASTVTCNIRFSQQYFDEETGFHYNTNRYYDPVSGRYTQTDPLGIYAGLNLYAFVENSPTYYTDPLGLECGACSSYSELLEYEGEKGIWRLKIKYRLRFTAKGQICEECCPDGTCGTTGSLSVSGQIRFRKEFKTPGLVGLKFEVGGAGGGGGGVAFNCDSTCGEFTVQAFGFFTVGGFVGFSEFVEGFVGGGGRICVSGTVEICAPDFSFNFKDVEWGFAGEIYAEIKIKIGKWNRRRRVTFWESSSCKGVGGI